MKIYNYEGNMKEVALNIYDLLLSNDNDTVSKKAKKLSTSFANLISAIDLIDSSTFRDMIKKTVSSVVQEKKITLGNEDLFHSLINYAIFLINLEKAKSGSEVYLNRNRSDTVIEKYYRDIMCNNKIQ